MPFVTDEPITVTMTDTVERTYVLTESDLESLGLPATVADLENLDTDSLSTCLLDHADEVGFAITEREIDISTEPAAR